MIELKIYLTSFTALAAASAALATVEGATLAAADVKPSATVTPEKQQAARDSVAQGSAAGTANTAKLPKEPKAEKAPKETPAPPPTPTDAMVDAIVKTSTVTPPKYEDSGLPKAITEANTKDSPATKAVLEKYNARNAEGKLKGSALKPEDFAAALADLEAIING